MNTEKREKWAEFYPSGQNLGFKRASFWAYYSCNQKKRPQLRAGIKNNKRTFGEDHAYRELQTGIYAH